MRWTIPNIFTVIRLLAAPGVALAFVAFARPAADWLALTLFVLASASDWVDGYLARRLDQTSRFGTMLDPIADKAMVIIALAVVMGTSGLDPLVVVPAALILFREVFVSGLREFLGADAGKLAVTKLAKWKTTVQMVALALIMAGLALAEEALWTAAAMTEAARTTALDEGLGDASGLWQLVTASRVALWAGFAALWLAALLTVMTGWDYFRKSLPFLREVRT